MTRYGAMYGPDVTFLGVPPCNLDERSTWDDAQVVILGAPYDGGTSYRSGARFGPKAIRQACYLEHDGSRPSLALGVDGLLDLRVMDAGDVMMFSGNAQKAHAALERAVNTVSAAGKTPLILGGDHSIALPNVTGVARAVGWGRVSVIHFDAHADTGDICHGSLIAHGQPMRRLLESGAARSDRFLQLGLRGYWPGPDTLEWMAEQGMRSYEMTEIVERGLETCLAEASRTALDDCDGVYLSVDVDVVDPGMAPGTGTPEPGGLTSRQLLDSVRRLAYELPIVGVEVVEVAPGHDHADITAMLGSRIVLEALSGIARRQAEQNGRLETWDRGRPLLEQYDSAHRDSNRRHRGAARG
ncbi:agmatinase [Embleya sp. NPDC020886]|uniref:agmatinase n=1 Tax=Embleya sp. NPDC020886 TaxID=3363980 RepID=UPI0037B36C02